jgi:hypothetical protein
MLSQLPPSTKSSSCTYELNPSCTIGAPQGSLQTRKINTGWSRRWISTFDLTLFSRLRQLDPRLKSTGPGPLTGTSANRTGENPAETAEEIIRQLGSEIDLTLKKEKEPFLIRALPFGPQ